MTDVVIQFDREVDGRWIAAIESLPGCLAYGTSREDARRRVIALALSILADRVENGETSADFAGVRFDDAA